MKRNHDPNKGLTEVLLFAFGIGCVWDVTTTFLGIVKIVGKNEIGSYGIALAGTAIIFAFNLATTKVWDDFKNDNWLLSIPWVGCIIFDFITSLEGNYKYVLPANHDEILVRSLILFITFLTTISPMMVNKLFLDFKDKSNSNY